MAIIKKLVHFYNKFEEYLLVYSLMFMVIIIFMQVIMRYVFNSSLSWSEELARYLFVWQVFLSASIGVRKNNQIRVEIFSSKIMGLKSKQSLELFINILIIGVYIVFLVAGYRSLSSIVEKNVVSIALRIPMCLVFSAIPFSAFVIIIRMVCRVIHDIKHFGEEIIPPLNNGKGAEI